MPIRQRGKRSFEISLDLPPGPDGKRRRRWENFRAPPGLTPTKALRAARDRERELRHEIESGSTTAPARQTVSSLLEEWLGSLEKKRRTLSPSTLRAYRFHARRIEKHLGGLQIHRVTAEHVEAALDALLTEGLGKTPLSASTVRQTHVTLRAVFSYAIQRKRIVANPAAGVEAYEVEAPVVVPLLVEDVAKITAMADEELGRLVWVAFALGLRVGEACGLRWSDLDESYASIRQQARYLPGRGVELVPPKTAHSIRSIRLDANTVRVLADQRRYQVTHRLRIGPVWQDNDLVFPKPDGTPRKPDDVSRSFSAAARSVGLATAKFHSLRHGSATLLLAGGVSSKAAAARLGHANPQVTAVTYSHLTRDIEGAAASVVEAALANLAQPLYDARNVGNPSANGAEATLEAAPAPASR